MREAKEVSIRRPWVKGDLAFHCELDRTEDNLLELMTGEKDDPFSIGRVRARFVRQGGREVWTLVRNLERAFGYETKEEDK